MLTLLAGVSVSVAVWAAEPDPDAATADRDHRLVLARTVNPRTAYRGLPPTANPSAVEAITFPGRVFDTVMHGPGEATVGDDALARTAPLRVGAAVSAVMPAMAGSAPMTAAGAAAAHAPLGSGASATRAPGGLDGNFGDRVNTALRPLSGGGR